MRKWKLFPLATFCLWLSVSSIANTLILDDHPSVQSLEDFLFIATSVSPELDIEDVLNSNQIHFAPFKEVSITEPTNEPIWIRFNLENKPASNARYSEWVLQFSLTFTDIEIYTIDKDQNMVLDKTGYFTPLSERSYFPSVKGNYAKLKLSPNKSYTIYAKLICERLAIAPELDLELHNYGQFQKTLNQKQRWNALYLGFVLMMLFYNLLIFLFAKDKTFLFYSLYLAGIGLFTAYNSGDLFDLITPLFFPQLPYLIYYFKLPVYLSMASYLFFLRYFLDLKNNAPFWETNLKRLGYLAFPCLLLDGAIMTATNFSYNISDSILITYATIFVFASFGILPAISRSKDFKRYFVIYGVLAMGIGTLFTIWARLQSIDFSTFYFRIGSIIEIVAFSLGLAYRHIQNEKEKQKVYYELEKSKLVQQQEQLEIQRIKENNQLKTRFYTNITHEFRTPLTVIQGITDSIKGNKKAKELILRNSKNLLSLINQLLDLSKVEKGKLTLKEEPTEIIQYLNYLIDSFSALTSQKNIRLYLNSTLSTLSVSIDREKLGHIVQNLISNAIKFTPMYGTIIVTVETRDTPQEEVLQVTIKDNGMGIREDELPHIFERFYQTKESATQSITGTGIGLSLTQEFVELMQGTITVNSQLDIGSEFIITLPLKRIVSQTTIPVQALETPELSYTIGNHSVDYEPNKKPIVLVIEDNLDVFIYIQHCLEQEYNLHLAQNGKIGITMAKELIPDIIISDVMMPEKDGFEVTTTLKSNEKTSHIPIILLTAKVSQEDKLKGLQYGADVYLTKPFNKQELLIRLNRIIENRNRLQTFYSDATFKDPIPHPAGKQAEIAFLEKLNEFIDENLVEADFSMANLSKFLSMSQIQVYRKIKSLTNQTPTQYIRVKRLDKALDLLQNSTLNISEIAYQVGYADPNYFSRTFNKEFGRTPSSFR